MPMLPEIRKAYLAALQALRAAGQEAKPLYHWSKDPEALVSNPRLGLPDRPEIVGGGEPWKPEALYASDSLRANTESMFGEPGGLDVLKRLLTTGHNIEGAEDKIPGGYVRIVPKPGIDVAPITEETLIKKYDLGADPNNIKRGSDLLQVRNADGQPGLTEHLIRNLKAVNIFSDSKAWLPALATAMFGVGASDADAMRIPGIPIPKRSATDILTKYFRTSDAAGSKPLEFLIDSAEGLKPKVDDIDSYVKSLVTSALKDAPEAPVNELIRSAQFNHIPMDVMKAATKRTSALTDLDRYVSPDAWQEIKKFAGIPAVAGMVGLGTTSDAEAGPRAQAIRKALQGVLYHGSDDIIQGRTLDIRPEVSGRHAAYLSDDVKLAERYGDVTPFRLDETARIKILREHKEGLTDIDPVNRKLKATLIRDGWDGVAEMPRDLSSGSAFARSELALVNPLVAKKLLGMGGLAAGGMLALGSNADAMPLGKLTQVTPRIAGKMMTKTVRSQDAFDSLVGHEFTNVTFPGRKHPGDYEVVDVLKHPKNDWRFVQMEDAEGNLFQLPMTKDYLHTLLGAKGMKEYSEVFKDLGAQGRDYQASKSVSIREAKRTNTSDVTNDKLHAYEASQADKVNEIDPKLLHDYLWARTPGSEKLDLMVPKDYATHLLKRGYDIQPHSQAYNPTNKELHRRTTNPIIPPRKGRPKS